MLAVTIATPIKTITALSEVVDSDARPLIPCPDVQPSDNRVPNPTSSPPRASLQSCTELVQNPVGESVSVCSRAPITSPIARKSRQLRSWRVRSFWKYSLFENQERVVVKKLLCVA